MPVLSTAPPESVLDNNDQKGGRAAGNSTTEMHDSSIREVISRRRYAGLLGTMPTFLKSVDSEATSCLRRKFSSANVQRRISSVRTNHAPAAEQRSSRDLIAARRCESVTAATLNRLNTDFVLNSFLVEFKQFIKDLDLSDACDLCLKSVFPFAVPMLV